AGAGIAGVGEAWGFALARRFAQAGFNVALAARSAERLASLAGEIKKAGGRAFAAPTDVREEQEVRALFDALESEHGAGPGARRRAPRGQGTILFTGATASIRGGAQFAAFAAAKNGLRAVAQSMARELGPKGIHVAHVVIDGMID